MTLAIRPAVVTDLPRLTEIYNHYIVHTAITFDLKPWAPEERRPWFDAHQTNARHRLVVATEDDRIVGYATSSVWRPKAAYEPTVESSVYCDPSVVGRGCGAALYTELFKLIAIEDVHRIVAGVTLPNDRSIRLHERLGFQPVGVFHAVGRKFDRYWDVAWFERRLRVD